MLDVIKRDGVARVTLNRPELRNAFDVVGVGEHVHGLHQLQPVAAVHELACIRRKRGGVARDVADALGGQLQHAPHGPRREAGARRVDVRATSASGRWPSDTISRAQQSCASNAGPELFSSVCGQQHADRSKPSIRQRINTCAGRYTSSRRAGASAAVCCHLVNRREITGS